MCIDYIPLLKSPHGIKRFDAVKRNDLQCNLLESNHLQWSSQLFLLLLSHPLLSFPRSLQTSIHLLSSLLFLITPYSLTYHMTPCIAHHLPLPICHHVSLPLCAAFFTVQHVFSIFHPLSELIKHITDLLTLDSCVCVCVFGCL